MADVTIKVPKGFSVAITRDKTDRDKTYNLKVNKSTTVEVIVGEPPVIPPIVTPPPVVEPPIVIPPAPTVSPDDAQSPPLAKLVDAQLNSWWLANDTAVGGHSTLKNGTQFGGGAGVLLLWKNAKIYTKNSGGLWYEAQIDWWKEVSDPTVFVPPPVVIPPPVVTPPPTTGQALSLVAYHEIGPWTDSGSGVKRNCAFGKETVWRFCPDDSKLHGFGGDGRGPWWPDWNSGAMGTHMTYDAKTRIFDGEAAVPYWGRVGDPVPALIDYCNVAWNSDTMEWWLVPGYQWYGGDSARDNDPRWKGIKTKDKIFTLDRSGKWTIKGDRHPFGHYEGQGMDYSNGRMWFIAGDNGAAGRLCWIDCATMDMGKEDIAEAYGAQFYCQFIVDGEIIWFECKTGKLNATKLTAPYDTRMVAQTVAVLNQTEDVAIALDRKNKIFMMCFQQWQVPSGSGIKIVTMDGRVIDGPAYPQTIQRFTQLTHDSANDLFIACGAGPEGITEYEDGNFYHYKVDMTMIPGGATGVGTLPTWRPDEGEVGEVPFTNTLRDVMYGTAAGPGSGSGVASATGYFNNWCSAANNPYDGAFGSALFSNGGDADYWGNEVYRASFNTLTWSRLNSRSTGLNGVTTAGGDSNFDDASWGEHTSPGGVPPPQPGVPHSYDQTDVLSPLNGGGTRGALIFLSRTIVYRVRGYGYPSVFKVEDATWYRGSSTPNLEVLAGSDSRTWCYDQTINRFWGLSTASSAFASDKLQYLDFGPSSPVVTDAGSFTIPTFTAPAGYCTSRYFPQGNLMIVCGRGASALELWATDVFLHGENGFSQLSLTGDTYPWQSFDKGYGFAYCDDLECFFVRAPTGNRQKLWQITPPVSMDYLNDPWDVEEITMGGVTVGSDECDNGYFKRFGWNSKTKLLQWIDSIDGPYYVYRPVGL